jgi:hypothetical protein
MKVFEHNYRKYYEKGWGYKNPMVRKFTHAPDLLTAEREFKEGLQKIDGKIVLGFSINRVFESSLINEIAHMITEDVYVDNVPEELDSWSPELEFSDDMITEIIDKVREIEEVY